MADLLLKEDGDQLLQEIGDAITIFEAITVGTITSGSAATAPEMVALAIETGTVASTSVATAPSDVAAGADEVTTEHIASTASVSAPTLVDHIFTGATIISGSAVFVLTVALAIDGATITSTSTATAPTLLDHNVSGVHLASTLVLYPVDEVAHPTPRPHTCSP